MSRRVATALAWLLFSAWLAGGCGGNNSDDCDSGSEGCPCNADGSCDSALTCASNRCVFIAGSGASAGALATAGAGAETGSEGGAAASDGGAPVLATGGSAGTRNPTGAGIKPKLQGGTGGSDPGAAGASTNPECPVCEGDTPICDEGDFTCKTCTEEAGCSGATPLCDEKANDGLGACVALGGEAGAGGAGSGGVPGAWTCVTSYYGDGDCDCGCGVVDVDCADESGASCLFCLGCSMSGGACPGRIDPANNAVCVELGWTCSFAYYGDGSCDCGCGVRDVDCADGSLDACDFCDGCNYVGTCPGAIDPTDNSRCQGWACSPAWLGDDACDCGCGEVDIDCPNSQASSCDFCLGCNTAFDCPGTIDPNDNAVCSP